MHWFTPLGTLNLIDVLTYYLILSFVVGTAVRLRNYRAIGGFIYRFPERWPKLLGLVKHYRAIFLRWPTLLPIGLTLALTLANMIASRLVWSHATVSVEDLWGRWIALLAVTTSAGLMGFLDCRAMFFFGRFNRAALEADLDRAEHWLQTWKAPALRVLTFGLINPRKLVNEQLRQALVDASLAVNGQMWRWSLQIGMRLAFGLALWSTWAVAVHGPAR
ncbi:MAG TPA: hypothetical protein VKA46_32600 [Gemmataceae bacterium]|nr:hypothetical protein [Gemmataceae bacterium]